MKKRKVVLELDEHEATCLIAALPDHGQGFPTLAAIQQRLLVARKKAGLA